jgi:hypothetical protein
MSVFDDIAYLWGYLRSQYMTVDEAKRKSQTVRQVFDGIDGISAKVIRLPGNLLRPGMSNLRPDDQFVSVRRPAKRLERGVENDRTFPLETVRLQHFRAGQGANIEGATIHTGPYADEMARSFSAFALTIGMDIFFRDRAYDPASEEGRRTLAHELAHVAQYEEGRVTRNSTREELEAEADLSEHREEHKSDPVVTLSLRGRQYRFPKSEMRRYAHKAAVHIKKWKNEQKLLLDGEEYLKFLRAYGEWMGGM